MKSKKVYQKLGISGALALLLLSSYGLLTRAPTATATVVQAPAADPVVHLVQRGDTLATIAQHYGTTVQALMNLNHLTSTTIFVGQRLVILAEQLPGDGIDTRYKVQPGDTLAALAVRFNTTVRSIMNANRLRSTTIFVGQILIMPRDFPAPGDQATYVVQRGDTLSALARRFNTTVAALMAFNQLHTTTIYVGQVLQVPAVEAPPPTAPPPPAPAYQWLNVSLAAPLAKANGQVTYGAPQYYAVHGMVGEVLTIYLATPGTPENASGLAMYAMSRAGGAPPGEHTPPTPGALPSSLTQTISGDGDLVIQVDATTAQVVDFMLLVEAKPANPPVVDCVASDATQARYVEPNGRYCLLYPNRFHVADEAPGHVGIYRLPLDQSNEPVFAGLTVIDEGPANGTPLQLVVDTYIMNNGEGANIKRQALLLGGEAAEVVEGLPGRTGSRQIFVVHAGEVYHLSFYPVDPAFPQAAADIEALWQTVTASFTFSS